VWTGEVTVGQAAHDVTLTASDGDANGTSEPFEVLPMPMFYQVTSPAYEYLEGEAFPVTVTAYDGTTINLWEDEHQDPDLETTSDWTLLETTPGEWTEFHYSSRPFPSVMAAHNEYEDDGLPLMHFFASGIPNGEYEVIANLYDNAPMRYFYGFTESTALDHWVDAAGGAGGTQHREYSLGTVTITGGTFDLYVQDANLLGGSYPIFGWAWVRLVPVESGDVTVNCWEDDHQEPVLATTESIPALNQTDGQWTEFLYTPSRPHPSILAAVDEYEDYGLPVMRFYASGLANGEYEVFANLYDNAAMRYFYGFTPGDPFAHEVDTLGGAPGTQHREYSLGMVTITDGTFNLYVQDADIQSGTYPFFGWAWIRLAAAGPLMSSSSPTMLFDGDGDGTFGEPGDNVKPLVDGSLTIMARDSEAGSGVEIRATDASGRFGYNTYTILSTNEPPVANDDYATTDEDEPVTFNALDNDSDPDDNLAHATAAVISGPNDGTVTGNYGSFTYSPDPDFYGPDAFEYEVCDTEGLCDTATVYITVNPVNDPPVVSVSLGSQTVPYSDDIAGVTFTAVDIDSAGVDLTGSATGVPSDLILSYESCTDDATGTTCTWTLNGAVNVAADAYDIAFTVSDGELEASISIEIVVIEEATQLSVDDASVQYSDSVELSATLTDDDDTPLEGMSVDFVTDACSGSATTNIDGVATFLCGPVSLPAGNYDIDVHYDGTEGYYESSSGAGTLTVVEEATQLTVDDASVQYSDSVELSATLTDDDNTPLEGVSVDFVTDACSGSATTNTDGVATFLCGPVSLPAGDYDIDVRYDGTEGYYESSSGAGTLTVVEEATQLTVDDASVQYSDSVELSATLTDDDDTPLEGKTLSFGVTGACSGSGVTDASGTATFLCSNVPLAAGSYGIEVTYEGDAGYYQATMDVGTLTVTAENAKVRFSDENPVAVRVMEAGGDSGFFELTFYVREAYNADLGEEPKGEPLTAPGDIGLAVASLRLVPVGPGSPVDGLCQTAPVTGNDYEARLPVTCSFEEVPVNTYTAEAAVGGGYYEGLGEDVLTVYDPSLGFATGGGWFYWPGTGEKTNFGFTMKYNKKGGNVKGSLLVIRHVGDEEIYRVKSNALYGLALGSEDSFGWATFSGKSTYLEPDWLEPIGNYEFVVYVEDRNEPGIGIDRFWIEVHDKEGLVVPVMSMERDGPTNAVEIGGGNIVVPH
jgi:hypothetical protein